MSKIILFYKYVSITDVHQIAVWQKKLCLSLKLKGRIILATEGINACLGGSDEAIVQYQTAMNEHPLFGNIDFKESPGDADCFPRLRVVIKNEIVHLGLDTQKISAANAGIHLEPIQAHQLIEKKPENLLLFDCRNKYESAIGTFAGSVAPKTKYFRELPTFIDEHLENFKDKQVLMFCTGGIRCERASAYLKSKNVAQEVYHIKGGIHRYVEQFPDGFFRGKNYVFDGRIALKVNEDILSQCALCTIACDEYTNCLNARCNKHFISCASCLEKYQSTCGSQCLELVKNNMVPIRPSFKKSTPDSPTGPTTDSTKKG